MKKALFYILNLTWGLIMTLIGGFAALALIAAGRRPTRHGGCLCFECGKGWGGVSLGLVMIVEEGADDATKNHEFGHAAQNALFGPLMPFAVGIPSAVRWHYYKRRRELCDAERLPPYDSIWFEAQATEWGNRYAGEWRNTA